jgi:hypothetical protein
MGFSRSWDASAMMGPARLGAPSASFGSTDRAICRGGMDEQERFLLLWRTLEPRRRGQIRRLAWLGRRAPDPETALVREMLAGGLTSPRFPTSRDYGARAGGGVGR